jgi:hypothetical protein
MIDDVIKYANTSSRHSEVGQLETMAGFPAEACWV